MCPDKMTKINSVLGPIDTASLGFTLMHEHVVASWAGIPQNYIELLGSGLMDRIIKGLTEAKEWGIKTIVDATTLDLGRDIAILTEASRLTGVKIITCTGWWLESPLLLLGLSPDQLARIFIREIEEGICGTDIKAGILKAASDAEGVNAWQEAVLRAVARAHLETNVPIMLHSYPYDGVGERQIAILKEEGVNLQRVVVGHSNDTADTDYLKWLLDQGCYLGMDRYPGHNDVNTQVRTKTLKTLLDAGYVDRLLPSHDWLLTHIMADSYSVIEFHEKREQANPHGFLYLKKVVIPQLQQMGVSQTTIDRLCVIGPRNYFEGV